MALIVNVKPIADVNGQTVRCLWNINTNYRCTSTAAPNGRGFCTDHLMSVKAVLSKALRDGRFSERDEKTGEVRTATMADLWRNLVSRGGALPGRGKGNGRAVTDNGNILAILVNPTPTTLAETGALQSVPQDNLETLAETVTSHLDRKMKK